MLDIRLYNMLKAFPRLWRCSVLVHIAVMIYNQGVEHWWKS
jgi:hypothetical protein